MPTIILACFVAGMVIGIAGHVKKDRRLSILSIAFTVIGFWGLISTFVGK
jgi:hypothetical protein